MSGFVLSFVFSRHFLTGAAFLVFSAGLGLFGLIQGGRATDLAARGTLTEAQVIAARVDSVANRTGGTANVTHLLSVAFTASGLPVTVEIPVTEAIYDQTAPGAAIAVRYLPDDPQVAEIVAGTLADDAAGFRGVGWVALAIGLFFMARAGWAARGAARGARA